MSTPDRLALRAAQEAAFAAMVPPAPDRPAAGPQPIAFPGDADPGGRDDVATDPAGAQASAEAHCLVLSCLQS